MAQAMLSTKLFPKSGVLATALLKIGFESGNPSTKRTDPISKSVSSCFEPSDPARLILKKFVGSCKMARTPVQTILEISNLRLVAGVAHRALLSKGVCHDGRPTYGGAA